MSTKCFAGSLGPTILSKLKHTRRLYHDACLYSSTSWLIFGKTSLDHRGAQSVTHSCQNGLYKRQVFLLALTQAVRSHGWPLRLPLVGQGAGMRRLRNAGTTSSVECDYLGSVTGSPQCHDTPPDFLTMPTLFIESCTAWYGKRLGGEFAQMPWEVAYQCTGSFVITVAMGSCASALQVAVQEVHDRSWDCVIIHRFPCAGFTKGAEQGYGYLAMSRRSAMLESLVVASIGHAPLGHSLPSAANHLAGHPCLRPDIPLPDDGVSRCLPLMEPS